MRKVDMADLQYGAEMVYVQGGMIGYCVSATGLAGAPLKKHRTSKNRDSKGIPTNTPLCHLCSTIYTLTNDDLF